MKYPGNPVSRGIVTGKVFVYKKEHTVLERRTVDESAVEDEVHLFDFAVVRAGEELVELIFTLEKDNAAEAKIFQAHADILRDKEITRMIRARISEKRITAEWAVEQVYDEFINLFIASGNEITAAKAADMKDVRRRIILALHGQTQKGLLKLSEPVIIAAHDLLPSDTATLEKEKVLAIVTETGGETSHTAILAKGFGIPALLGISEIASIVKNGEEIIVDAVEGFLITDPTEQERNHYCAEEKKLREKKAFENRFLGVRAVTLDGVRIFVEANIGSCSEEELKAAPYTDGVGLLRTEFLYMQNDWLPGENDQFRAYSNILGAYRGKPVVLRTIDIGGDKQLPGLIRPEEANPFLGCRALRLCFVEPELFKAQLRAAFRASVYGELWIMFPMVCCMEDIRKAKDIIARVRKELNDEGISVADNIKIGIMIEIPSIALIADQVVKEVDFASIGTNDLCQYLTASDRMNPQTGEYYQPCHPAMLRLIRSMTEIFSQHKKPLGVCGEMASDAVQASLLLGLGITSLSVNVARIAAIKSLICGSRMRALRQVADFCCGLSSAEEVQEYCRKKLLREE